MIYVIHGQNEVDSRRFMAKFKLSYDDLRYINGKNLTKGTLEKIIDESSNSLFGGKSAILIDDFTSSVDILPQNAPRDLDIIVWSARKLPIYGKNFKSFVFDKSSKANVFKLSDATLFKREKSAQILLDELLQSKEPPEKIIGALTRGLCFIYFVKERTINRTNLPPFIQQKHIDQSNNWTSKSIKKGVAKLILADLAIKEGLKTDFVLTNLISELANLPIE